MKNILSNSNGSKERYQIYMENEVKNSNQIVLTAQGEETIFYVLEQTTLNGVNYLLVTDKEEEEAYILKDSSEPSEEEALYTIVEDEKELSLIGKIFEELLDDVELVSQE